MTSWGQKVFLVPMKVPTAGDVAALRLIDPTLATLIARQAARGEALTVISPDGGGGRATAEDIEAGLAIGVQGAGRSFSGGDTQSRVIAVVYRHSLIVRARVSGNVAAIQVARQCCTPGVPMIWYAADGRVLERFGDFAAANRGPSVAAPRPGRR